MKNYCRNVLYFLTFTCFCHNLYSQNVNVSAKQFRLVKAGPQYKRSPFYTWLMGRNYRNEWTTAVRVPVLLLDTAKGGLTPYKAGGGHQTKSLHIKTAKEKEYALRSVDKSLGKVLPEILHNTFLENIVNDEVSMSHPYGAASIPVMAQKAGIFYTTPQFVYLPKQRLLDTFNNIFGDNLYLFEQRVSGDWKDASNLGNSEKYIDTYDLLEELKRTNKYEVDQRLFLKSRLFDMFIGDWDRHEDQWEWALSETKGKKIYRPVPQDRDQAYFKYDGKLLKLLIGAAGLKYFQSFDHTLPNVKTFNYEERNLDRFFTNQMNLQDWQNAAHELQRSLTDEVIEHSIKQLPPEIFSLSGDEIISKLKSRRAHLQDYATTYYEFIAKEVEVVGSKEDETFLVTRINDAHTSVKVYGKSAKDNEAIYSRIFNIAETKEVRLYGIAGHDTYTIDGNVNKGLKIRVIGGYETDSITDRSVVKSGSKKTVVYDNPANFFAVKEDTKLHLSSDTTNNSYKYFNYLYDKKGVGPAVFYNYEDRLFVGINAKILHHRWRAEPFAYMHNLSLNYSISQHAISVNYHGTIPKAIGKWDLLIDGNFDAIRWTKFFGTGNETALLTNYNDFYRLQSREWMANIGINRKIQHNDISINGFFQSSEIVNDAGRFVPKIYYPYPTDLGVNNFAGAKISYLYDHVNDSTLPTNGFTFSGAAAYNHNLTYSGRNFGKFSGSAQLYVPLSSHFSLSLKAAGLTVAGNPLFYQYVSIGGPETLRGYRLERFWGKTGYYNANELRYITNIKSHIFNGKAGVLALFDNGRVWMPGETSNTLHTAYGGGVLFAPFNKILIVVTYARSTEMGLFQLRVGRSF